MIERAGLYGCYVYRRVVAMLIDAGWHLSDKQVERLWRREGAQGSYELTNEKSALAQ